MDINSNIWNDAALLWKSLGQPLDDEDLPCWMVNDGKLGMIVKWARSSHSSGLADDGGGSENVTKLQLAPESAEALPAGVNNYSSHGVYY